MEELLKKLMESDLLTESTKASLEKAFHKKLDEARSEIEAQVRAELAEKNNQSRELLINACESMIRDGLKRELEEFAIDHKQAKRMSVKAAKAIAEAETKAKKKLAVKLSVMERMLKTQLGVELKEFHQDQKVNRKATIRAINEAKQRAERDRKLFVKRGAKILETICEKHLRAKLTELHEDIVQARKNDFGRRIFEAYQVEMRNSFFNETSEVKKLATRLANVTSQLEESKKSAANQKQSLNENLAKEKRTRMKLEESVERKKIIESLLSRLEGSARVQMRELLESAPTAKLRDTFRKFLPSVTDKTPKDGRLNETRRTVNEAAKLRTGNKVNESRDSASTQQIDEELAQMARNAGLRVIG